MCGAVGFLCTASLDILAQRIRLFGNLPLWDMAVIRVITCWPFINLTSSVT